jgi:hypothetical protein
MIKYNEIDIDKKGLSIEKPYQYKSCTNLLEDHKLDWQFPSLH